MKKLLLPILGIMAIAATGCSSSSGSATPTAIGAPTTGYPAVSPPGTTTAPASKASAVFTISVPAKTASSSKARKPDYVSVNTQSVSIALTSVNGTGYSAVAPLSAACTTTCTITFNTLPIGTDGFTVTTYNSTVANQAPSAALSTNTVTATVAVATVTSVPLTLNGIISSLGVTVGAPSVVPGTASTHAYSIVANDVSGAQIIGSANYNNGPITVATDDTVGAISGLTTSLASPSSGLTFSYNGTSIQNTHISASVPNGVFPASAIIPVSNSTESLSTTATSLDAAPSTLTSAAGTNNISTGGDAVQVIKVSQSGWGSALSHPFTITNTCGAGVGVTNTATDTFTLNSTAVTENCSVTFSGGGGATAAVSITQLAGVNGINVPVN